MRRYHQKWKRLLFQQCDGGFTSVRSCGRRYGGPVRVHGTIPCFLGGKYSTRNGDIASQFRS